MAEEQDQLYSGIQETLKKHGIGVPAAPVAKPASEITVPAPAPQAPDFLSGIHETLQKHGVAVPGGPQPAPAAPSAVQEIPPQREDFTNKFNTALPPEQETKFQAWMKDRKNAVGGLVANDLADYDVRGRWQQLEAMSPEEKAKAEAPGAHGPDTWKKPSHITFSNESKYHGIEGHEGGTWGKEGDQDTFTPGPSNLKIHGQENLQKYFTEREPGIKLQTPGPRGVPLAPAKTGEPGLLEEPVIGAKEAMGDLVSRWASLIDPGSFMGGMGVDPNTPEARAMAEQVPETREGKLATARKAMTAGMFPEGEPAPAEGLGRGILRGLGAAPVALTELAMLAPLAGEAPGIAKGAITFALQGLTGEKPITGAIQGAALGAVLGLNHQLAGKIANPVVQWLARITGGAAVGGGAAAVAGGGPKEITRDAIIFGLFEVMGMPRGDKNKGWSVDWKWMEDHKVPKQTIDALKYESPESPEFVKAVDEASRSFFGKTPQPETFTPEQQRQSYRRRPPGKNY